MKTIVLTVVAAIHFTLFAVAVFAAQIEPASLAYQGTLTDNTGQPIIGSKTVYISLYDTPTGGTPFWTGTYNLMLKNGQFSVVLGSDTNPLGGKLASFNGTTYLGVRVDPDQEMPLRQKLTSVAYSLHAAHAANADLAQNAVLAANATNAVDAVNAVNGVPKGVIVMWSGPADQVPAGWALCNGTNATPNLLGRFIVGAGVGTPYGVGATGGAEFVGLDITQIPNHSHNIPTTNGSGGGGYEVGQFAGGLDYVPAMPTTFTGGSQAHENRPPYYALAYIMKL